MASMLRNENPLFLKDVYKTGHAKQYPLGTERIQSNHTARKSRVPGINHVTYAGLDNYFELLVRQWEPFFRDATLAKHFIAEYEDRCVDILGHNVDTSHLRELQRYGRLPLDVHSVPEGTLVPIGVPMMTIENTHPCGYFLPQMIETDMSSRSWMTLTSATTAVERRRRDNIAVGQSGGPKEMLPYLTHGFEYRGMGGIEAAIMAGIGHLIGFDGTDTIPAMIRIQEVYGHDLTWSGRSVAATEHSVMCVAGEGKEFETYKRLLEIYPDVPISIVSDTWNLWRVVSEYLPSLGDLLTKRTAPVIIRPDSGDPLKILTGNPSSNEGIERQGLVPFLLERFGNRETSKGYRLLPQFLGTVYGDAMNMDRCDKLNDIVLKMKICPTTTVRGMGSYQHQYVTRDTFGQAFKGTDATVNGVECEMFKDPITGDGEKKSMKGRVGIVRDKNGNVVAGRDCLSIGDDTGYTYNPLRDGRLFLNGSFSDVRKQTGVWS